MIERSLVYNKIYNNNNKRVSRAHEREKES